jgi:hypothetical protein
MKINAQYYNIPWDAHERKAPSHVTRTSWIKSITLFWGLFACIKISVAFINFSHEIYTQKYLRIRFAGFADGLQATLQDYQIGNICHTHMYWLRLLEGRFILVLPLTIDSLIMQFGIATYCPLTWRTDLNLSFFWCIAKGMGWPCHWTGGLKVTCGRALSLKGRSKSLIGLFISIPINNSLSASLSRRICELYLFNKGISWIFGC